MRFQMSRGTHDILPREAPGWRFVEQSFLELTRLYGYEEIRTPVFEDTDLFVRTSGDTSDIVTKQMYTFEDKGGRSLTLKPEGTAPVIRSYLEHSLGSPGQVTRLSYITQIFRYERPQKGRYRQAHQVGLELVGSSSAQADAEVIEITVKFYRGLGLGDIRVLMNCIGRGEARSRYGQALLAHMKPYLADQDEAVRVRVAKNPLRMLDSKDPAMQLALEGCPQITSFIDDESRLHFDSVLSLMSEAAIPFDVRPEIVRGLDYYTDVVFEVQSSSLGAQSALCGGGRYDHLVSDIGGPATPSVGVAMGIERALIAMEDAGTVPAPISPAVFVVAASEDARAACRTLIRELRDAGVATVGDMDGKSMKSQVKSADRLGCQYVLLLGEDEMQQNVVSLREMSTGEQRTVARCDVVNALRGKD